jgi:Tfp pilus assembly protein PilF
MKALFIFYTVLKADPSNTDAKKELAAIYEILGETRKALDLVLQGTSFQIPIVNDVDDQFNSH